MNNNREFLLEALSISAVLIGGLALLVFSLGHFGVLTPLLLVPLGGIVLVLSVFLIIAALIKDLKFGMTSVEKLLACFAAVPVVLALPLALMPPNVRDELIQHLALPKLYLESGRILELPALEFSYGPIGPDLLYLIPLSIGFDMGARLIHLGFGVLTGLTVFSFVRARLGISYGLLSFFLFALTPLIFNLSSIAYADLALGFFACLSFVTLFKWRDTERDKWLYYSALSMGMALGCKYNALVSLMCLTFMVLYFATRMDLSKAKQLRYSVLFFVIALLVFSPYLLRNIVWTGNPLFPMFSWLVSGVSDGGGVNLGVGLAPLLKREALYNESLLQILLVPVRIFTSGRDDSIEFFDGVLNPLYLVFILLAFITRRNFELKIMAAYAVVYFVVAFFMVDLVSRYLMPVIPIMIIIVVYGVRNSFEQRRFFVVPIIIFLLIGAMNIKYALDLYTKRGAPGYFLSDETREGYLVRTAPDYGAIAFANKNLSSEAKVKAFFTGARGYYWEREFVNSSVFGSEILAIVRSSNGRMSISGAFKKDGTTHIFVRDTLFIKFIKDNLSEAELDKMKNFFVTGMRLLYSSNGYTLYELN